MYNCLAIPNKKSITQEKKVFYALISLAAVCDLVILDWLIISKITPRFVIIPGTEVRDYKDFSHHYKGHAKAAILVIPLCLIIAAVVVYI